jgi:hypothetical protein
MYPDLASNLHGNLGGFDIGITFLWGNDGNYASPGVGIFRMDGIGNIMVNPDNTELVAAAHSNFSSFNSGRAGDYMTVNSNWPNSSVFTAFTYRVIKDESVAAKWRWDCMMVRFGRKNFFYPTDYFRPK